jgi:hypothetical protein
LAETGVKMGIRRVAKRSLAVAEGAAMFLDVLLGKPGFRETP